IHEEQLPSTLQTRYALLRTHCRNRLRHRGCPLDPLPGSPSERHSPGLFRSRKEQNNSNLVARSASVQKSSPNCPCLRTSSHHTNYRPDLRATRRKEFHHRSLG